MIQKRKFTESTATDKKSKMSSLVEDGFMNFYEVPSLKDIAVNRIAASLWRQPNIINMVKSSWSNIRSRDPNYLQNACSSIESNVATLRIPEAFKDRIINVIRPIGLEFMNIVKLNIDDHHSDFFCSRSDNYIPGTQKQQTELLTRNIASLTWKMTGTIDERKEFEILMKGKCVGERLFHAYNMACRYSFENHVKYLWKKLPHRRRKEYSSSKKSYRFYRSHLTAYWSLKISNKLSNLMNWIRPHDHEGLYRDSLTINENMVSLCISQGLMTSLKYFFFMLTGEQISCNIVKWTEMAIQGCEKRYDGPYAHEIPGRSLLYEQTSVRTDIMLFLFSNLDDKAQQIEILRQHYRVVITSLFYNWPWQKYLIPTLHLVWSFMTVDSFKKFLCVLTPEIRNNKNVRLLIRDIWTASPVHLKTGVVKQLCECTWGAQRWVWDLFEVDIETANLIMNDADNQEKKKIISNMLANNQLFFLIEKDNLDVLDEFIKSNISSELDIEVLKDQAASQFDNFFMSYSLFNKGVWDITQKLLKWCYRSQQEIDKFKTRIDSVRIASTLVCQGDFEMLDKFVDWRFDSETEIREFKRSLMNSIPHFMAEKSWEDDKHSWFEGMFQKLVKWRLKSIEDERCYKMILSDIDKIASVLASELENNQSRKFTEFVLSWCLESAEKVKEFKNKLFLSDAGIEVFGNFCFRSWELGRICKFYHPLDSSVLADFKEKLSESDLPPSHWYSNDYKKEEIFQMLEEISVQGKMDFNDDSSVYSYMHSDYYRSSSSESFEFFHDNDVFDHGEYTDSDSEIDQFLDFLDTLRH